SVFPSAPVSSVLLVSEQDGAQCYGALGGTVVLQLMDSTSEIFRYEWSKNNKTAILQGGKNKKLINQIENRSSFSDGTFRINNLSRNDSGEYTLQTYDSNVSHILHISIFCAFPVLY
uniref:Immunoglobulin V-set domain-containing protein n=1 Tax=Lates calcarifer TaxID=8187 RepID=A0A4W6C0F5_LATCA